MTHPLTFVLIALVTAGCATSDRHHQDVQRRVEGRAGPEALQADPNRLGEAMTVDDVVAVALARNQGLQARFDEIDFNVGRLIASGAVTNPELEFEVHVPVGDAEGGTSFELALLQEVNTFLTLGPARRAAKFGLERSKALVASAVLELGAQAREATWEYAAARKLVELRRAVVQATDASYRVAVRLHEAGNVARLEVAQRKAARAQARLDLRRTERNALAARETMNRVMGLHGDAAATWQLDTELPPVPPTDELPLDELESIAVGSSLALEADRFGLEGAAARGRATAWGTWPHLSLGVVTEIEPAEGFTAVGPAVELSLPIWSFGRGHRLAARADLDRAQSEYTRDATELRSNVREAREVLAESGDRARFIHDELLPLRREITEETMKQYNAMHVGVFELLLAKEAEIDAIARSVEATRDYWVARTRVDLVIHGGPAMPAPSAGPAPKPPTEGGH